MTWKTCPNCGQQMQTASWDGDGYTPHCCQNTQDENWMDEMWPKRKTEDEEKDRD